MRNFNKFYLLTATTVLLLGCKDNPRVIEARASDKEITADIFKIERAQVQADFTARPENERSAAIHRVMAKKVLPTARYVYVFVEENGEEFWLATNKMDIQIGAFYLYKEGLFKSNFTSKEHNRVFEKLYLVASLVRADHGNEPTAFPEPDTNSKPKPVAAPGSIKIAELVDDPGKFQGQVVKLSAECRKVNANIMGKHWLHLKDGSKDDYDLVATSKTQIPEGHFVTITGTVVLQKDLGSGYYYDILIEDAEVIL